MTWKNLESRVIATCYHCGNKGVMDVHGIYDTGTIEDEDSPFWQEFKWTMLICPVCKKVSLLEKYSDVTMFNKKGQQIYQIETIYPRKNFIDDNVPVKIRAAFESAIKIKNIDTALSIISIRKALELLCKDKQAEGRNLEEMIRDLVKKNILPSRFDSACEIIRKLGNNAVHGDEAVFYVYEVDELISVLSVLLTYLYTLPVKLDKLKKKLNDPKGMM